MAKASLKLLNGTVVQIEGTTEEVKKLLDSYGGKAATTERNSPKKHPFTSEKGTAADSAVNFSEIVNLVKDCDEADAIETKILDRSSQVDRTLLPLYIVHEYKENTFGLTSGEVSKITSDLGIPISQPNASRALAGTASRYVVGDKVKKKGQTVRYKLSRRGVKYIKAVLKGTESAD